MARHAPTHRTLHHDRPIALLILSVTIPFIQSLSKGLEGAML